MLADALAATLVSDGKSPRQRGVHETLAQRRPPLPAQAPPRAGAAAVVGLQLRPDRRSGVREPGLDRAGRHDPQGRAPGRARARRLRRQHAEGATGPDRAQHGREHSARVARRRDWDKIRAWARDIAAQLPTAGSKPSAG